MDGWARDCDGRAGKDSPLQVLLPLVPVIFISIFSASKTVPYVLVSGPGLELRIGVGGNDLCAQVAMGDCPGKIVN